DRIERAGGAAPCEILTRRGEQITGRVDAIEGRYAIGRVVLKIIAVEHITAVVERDFTERGVHGERLLRFAVELAGNAFIQCDPETLRFVGGVQAGPVDPFERELFEQGGGGTGGRPDHWLRDRGRWIARPVNGHFRRYEAVERGVTLRTGDEADEQKATEYSFHPWSCSDGERYRM